jgi:glutathione S-transferase
MVTIYHVRGTRSVRPIWLCYELGLDVHVEPISFSRRYRDSPEWRAISPAGKVPVMTDGDLTMFESGAMVEYLLERYGQGRLRPARGTGESALYLQWCWFSEATLARPLGLNPILGADAKAANLAAEGEQKLRNCLAVVDRAVADRAFLLGADFTAADIMMGYSLDMVGRFGVLDQHYPDAIEYLDRLKSREPCARAMSL